MGDRKGWTKEPASRAGWTKQAVAEAESPDEAAALDAYAHKEKPDSLDFMKGNRPVGAAMGGTQQGVTLGFGDELTGAAGVSEELANRAAEVVGLKDRPVVDADPSRNPNGPEIKKSWGASQPAGNKPIIPETATDPRKSLADIYLRIRDRDRDHNKASAEAQPLAFGGGELAGGLAAPIPGSGLMKGAPLAAKMGLGAAQAGGMGAMYGLGKSEASDLEGMKNEALDTGLKAAPFGAAGAAVGHGLGKLGERFGARAEEVKAAKALIDAEKKKASAIGTANQIKQDANRGFFNIKEAEANPNVSDAFKSRSAEFRATQEAKDFAESIADNTLGDMPNKMSKFRAAQEAVASAPADAAKETAEYFAKSTLKEDVLPRVKNYASRMVPQAVADAVGDMAGGAKGVAAGALGAMTGAALGKPGTSLGNLMQKTPRFNAQLFEGLQSGANLSEEALQKLAAQLGVRVEDLAGDKLRKRFGGE